MPLLRLLPLQTTIDLPVDADLRDHLFPFGVEFPCGAAGRCRGCRVRVIEGDVPITPEMQRAFSAAELAAGWRLACRSQITGGVTLDIAQFDATILSDSTPLAVEPRPGFGIAIDVGTTTIAAQLLDLTTGHVHAVDTLLNPQAACGADIMTRIEYAVSSRDAAAHLTSVLRKAIDQSIANLLRTASTDASTLQEIVLCGNTVMHHSFGGLDLSPLAAVPFSPAHLGTLPFTPAELNWQLPPDIAVAFLPCLGGFVGSDILAGIVATDLHNAPGTAALIDLGTNGEIVVTHNSKLVTSSTAAGPAFEAGRIHLGMRAAAGAIDAVSRRTTGHGYRCHVIGGGQPRGICGSGLVSAASAALRTADLLPNGRFRPGLSQLDLTPEVYLRQSDIRQLQLAKGAVSSGLAILLELCGTNTDRLTTLYLGGAFGNYLDLDAAARIGLTPPAPTKIQPVGNCALRGAKQLLLSPSSRESTINAVLSQTEHFSLNEHPSFQDVFVDHLSFPAGTQ
ncbi:MAG: DUF4445 domain-containing protein [Bryobacterales bacterium]|nr:DUF4445 domain-containing protein [Bryobacterales bacterium]